MPAGGSVEGSEAGSVGGSVVSTIGAEVSTMLSGILLIDTSVQDNKSGIKNLILPPFGTKSCSRKCMQKHYTPQTSANYLTNKIALQNKNSGTHKKM